MKQKRFVAPLFVLASLGLTACEPAVETTEEILRPVRYMTVVEDGDLRSRTFSGTSRSTQISRMSFKVSGTVVELPIDVGDQLAAGALMARLDASSFELEAQQAQANLVQAQANQRNASANYERVKGLYEDNNASRNDLDSARANAESAAAQMRAAQKSLELARLNRSYTRLTADRDCTVASVNVDVNENVNAGTEIATVNCGQALEIEVAIPDSLISAIRPNTAVEIRFDAIEGTVFAGSVRDVGVATSSGSPTFPVILSVDDTDPGLRSGLSGNVTFQFATNRSGDAHLIPLAAVGYDGDNAFVYIAVPADQRNQALIEKRSVSIGELTDLGLEITTGLQAGDRVVTAGVSVIRDGQRVLLN